MSVGLVVALHLGLVACQPSDNLLGGRASGDSVSPGAEGKAKAKFKGGAAADSSFLPTDLLLAQFAVQRLVGLQTNIAHVIDHQAPSENCLRLQEPEARELNELGSKPGDTNHDTNQVMIWDSCKGLWNSSLATLIPAPKARGPLGPARLGPAGVEMWGRELVSRPNPYSLRVRSRQLRLRVKAGVDYLADFSEDRDLQMDSQNAGQSWQINELAKIPYNIESGIRHEASILHWQLKARLERSAAEAARLSEVVIEISVVNRPGSDFVYSRRLNLSAKTIWLSSRCDWPEGDFQGLWVSSDERSANGSLNFKVVAQRIYEQISDRALILPPGRSDCRQPGLPNIAAFARY